MGQKVALALSGGGARGLAHIGAIEVLEQKGFEISSISGTSAGSLIGGIYAMDKLPEFTEWILKLRKRDVFSLMDFSLSKGGMIKGEKVFNKLRTFIPDKYIENLKIPFYAIATDILKQKEIVFTKGSVYDAIRASVSVPDVFTPVKQNNSLLVDGGVLNPIPLNRVKRTEGDILVGVNLYSTYRMNDQQITTETIKKESEKIAKRLSNMGAKIFKSIKRKDKISAGYLKLVELSTSAMINQLAELEIELAKPDIVINIASDLASLFEFYKADYLIDYGRKQAEKSIKEYLGS